MLKLRWAQAAAWRLRQQHLDQRSPAGSMLAVASSLCGLHAQVLSSAELTLWARMETLDRGAVQRALWEERTLVKTWAMRGTLHLLPASELPLWYGALGTSPRYLREGVWKKHFGVTLQQLDELNEAVGTALDGQIMTREELALAAMNPILGEGSWGTILKPAAFAGQLCFGPSAGQRVRFTRPDSWLSTTITPLDATAATAEVARRFLTAYGPATYHDLARWWGGGGVATARQWITSLGDEVTTADLDGEKAWLLAAHTAEIRELAPAKCVRLLPAFDQYVVAASRHAGQLLPGDFRGRVYRPQGWLSPILLVNGRMEGVWRHEPKSSRIEVTIEPFVKASTWVRRAANQEAERLAAFLGGAAQVVWKI